MMLVQKLYTMGPNEKYKRKNIMQYIDDSDNIKMGINFLVQHLSLLSLIISL